MILLCETKTAIGGDISEVEAFIHSTHSNQLHEQSKAHFMNESLTHTIHQQNRAKTVKMYNVA